MKTIPKILIASFYLFLMLLLFSCNGASQRIPISLPGPGGTIVTCFQPPADVVSTTAMASANAVIPKVVDAVKADISVKQTYERVRTEIPNLQAMETVEFKLCVAYANGIMSKEEYVKFLSVLPWLKQERNVMVADQTVNLKGVETAISAGSITVTVSDRTSKYEELFPKIRTNELDLARAGEDAFKKEDYAWAVKFLEQSKQVELSGVWQADFPYLAGAYLNLGKKEEGKAVLNEMISKIQNQISSGSGYLGWKTTLGFLLSNLGTVRNLLPQEFHQEIDNTIDKVITLRKSARD